MRGDEVYERLRKDVIDVGLCSHCGTCAGMSEGTIEMVETDMGPLPIQVIKKNVKLNPEAYDACPGKGLDYPTLFSFVFGKYPKNWLIGPYHQMYVGYSKNETVRRASASGGIITQVLLYLLENNIVDGAVVLQHGYPKPWLSTPIIARTQEEILASSQSVYVPIPLNKILGQINKFDGRLAYVGLPDQVTSLRMLQKLGHHGAKKVSFVLGPYVGTMMYLEAIRNFLKSNGIDNFEDIAFLRYRSGEWPGKLKIQMLSGETIGAEKFYYNYLIPFYITRSTLFTVDFTNELTDISVGDAWHPNYERERRGYSIVISRTNIANDVLNSMNMEGQIYTERISLDDALCMHGHMLDFKKRGAFIRIGWQKCLGRKVPEYGYVPDNISFSRKLVEVVISMFFFTGKFNFIRWIITHIPISILGPVFNYLRIAWKNISKPSKRKGLQELSFSIIDHGKN